MIKKLSFLIGLLLFGVVFGQKKELLQKQNAELKKQIAAINADLAKTRNESKLSVAYLNSVNKKIGLREKVYNNTQNEKKFLDDDIYLRQLEINRQNRELAVLRKNYAQVLVNAYKNKGVQNKVTFILSSKNMGEAIRRVQYLKEYSDYQKRKAQEITGAAEVLRKSVTEKQKSAKNKEILLSNQVKDLKTISAEKIMKEQLLKDFKKNESKLTAELQQKQNQSKKLEGQIRSIISEEIKLAKANDEARKKAEAEKVRIATLAAEKEKAKIDAVNKARADALEKERIAADLESKKAADLAARKAADEKKRTEEAAKNAASERDEERRIAAAKDAANAAAAAKVAADKAAAARAAENALTKKNDAEKKAVEAKVMTNFGVSTAAGNNFAANRGKIGFPVEKGQVTHRFGRQPHPVFKNIVEENNGIKISVPAGTRAKCVFPGTVSKVLDPGDGTRTVIIRHGDYYSIYSNLSNSTVSANQQVSAGTQVGTVAQDFDGTNTLDFQIWNGKNPVDPLGWISY